MKILNIKILALLFIVSSCASTKFSNSTLIKIQSNGEGGILTVNLSTNKKLLNQKDCRLMIESTTEEIFLVQLKEGENHYAINIPTGKYSVKKIHCGLFYYYDLTKYLAGFTLNPSEITYLGGFKVSLLEAGVLDITTYAKGQKEMQGVLKEIGIMDEAIVLQPL